LGVKQRLGVLSEDNPPTSVTNEHEFHTEAARNNIYYRNKRLPEKQRAMRKTSLRNKISGPGVINMTITVAVCSSIRILTTRAWLIGFY